MHTPADDEVFAALLDQSAWIRRLAGSLVRDDALADDLTQDSLVVALDEPFRSTIRLRYFEGLDAALDRAHDGARKA